MDSVRIVFNELQVPLSEVDKMVMDSNVWGLLKQPV